MSTILSVQGSPRGERSHSRRLQESFLKAWQVREEGRQVLRREVGRVSIPAVTEGWIAAAFHPQPEARSDSISRAAEIMRDADVGVVPVVDDAGSMRLAGVVTDRDIAVRVVAEGRDRSTHVRDVMSSGLATVGPDDDLDRVTEVMKAQQVRRVPVCEGDRLVGIIAQADVAREGRDRKTGDVVEKISEPGRGRR